MVVAVITSQDRRRVSIRCRIAAGVAVFSSPEVMIAGSVTIASIEPEAHQETCEARCEHTEVVAVQEVRKADGGEQGVDTDHRLGSQAFYSVLTIFTSSWTRAYRANASAP